MRLFLALASGFAATLGIFGAGAVLATFYLVGPTQERNSLDASSNKTVWSPEPVRVAYAPAEAVLSTSQAPGAIPAGRDPALAETDSDSGGLDIVTEAAASTPGGIASDEVQTPSAEAEMLAAAHLDWCFDRYRSYRPEDNSYRPYGGGRAFCESPYLGELQAAAETLQPEEGRVVRVEYDGYDDGLASPPETMAGYATIDGPLTDEHIRYCFDRYRSYRPADNTYQPYGGGPRRQCL